MPDPHDTLSIFAEVAVALAGFSGIVIAFGRRSLGALDELEVRRLSNLFGFSGAVLLSSLVGMSLLHVASIDLHVLWSCASGLTIAAGVPWMVFDSRRLARLGSEQRAQVPAAVLYPFNVAGVFVLALQLANVILIHAAWPFFLGLVLCISFALQQFILLVRMGFRDA